MIANLLLLGGGRGGRMCRELLPGDEHGGPWAVITEEARDGSRAVDLALGHQGCGMIRRPHRKLQDLFLRKVGEAVLWDRGSGQVSTICIFC